MFISHFGYTTITFMQATASGVMEVHGIWVQECFSALPLCQSMKWGLEVLPRNSFENTICNLMHFGQIGQILYMLINTGLTGHFCKITGFYRIDKKYIIYRIASSPGKVNDSKNL